MNRIYRRIWNHAKGCWDVASELTMACGRKSSRATGAGGLLMVALLLTGGDAHAKTRYYIGCDPFNLGNGEFVSCSPITGRYDDTMFVGYALTNGLNSLGYGAGVNMKGDNTTAFGIGARIDGQNSAAFGFKARTSGVDSVAFGYNASANGGHALAMGANAYTGALGATAVGNDAAATRQNAVALGSGSSAEKENAVALGANAWSNGVDGVALGSRAQVETGAGTGGVAIGGGARAGSLATPVPSPSAAIRARTSTVLRWAMQRLPRRRAPWPWGSVGGHGSQYGVGRQRLGAPSHRERGRWSCHRLQHRCGHRQAAACHERAG